MKIILDDVIKDIAAGPFGSNLKVECFTSAGFPIIDGANLKGIKVTDNITKFVTVEKAMSLKRSIAKKGDVVVTISGTVGQIAYIPKNSRYENYLVSQRQFRVTFDSEKVYVPYLVYYFHTYEGQSKIFAFKNQTGVPALAQPLKNFRNIEIDLPPLDIQKRQISLIELIQEGIDLNNLINKNLLEIARCLFDQEYQKTTNMVPFSNLIHINGGGTPKTNVKEYWDGSIPFFTPKDVGSPITLKTEKYITPQGLSKCSSRLFPEGTTFVTARGTVGKLGIAGVPMAMNQSCYALTSDIIPSNLIYFFAEKAIRSLKKKASGAVFNALVTRDFSLESIKEMDSTALSRLSEVIEPIIGSMMLNEVENLQLTNLRDLLLPKLLSSEVEIR